MLKIKRDKFRRSRGGNSRFLNIYCANCKEFLLLYQKDGPGILKRMYLDRIEGISTNDKELACPNCDQILGTKMIYEKESRPAYRLFVGAISKSIVK